MSLARGDSGGGGGRIVSADLEVAYDANTVDPIPVLYEVPGSKQSTVSAATRIASLQALTAGVFTIDGTSTGGIDFSGIPAGVAGVTPAVNLLNTALAAVPALSDYTAYAQFVNPNFFFGIRRTGGDVGTLSGTVATAMALDTITTENHVAASNPLMIAAPSSGFWRELRFYGIVEMGDANTESIFQSTYISDGTDTFAWASGIGNRGNYRQAFTSNEPSGLYTIGVTDYFALDGGTYMFNPITNEITWDNPQNFVPTQARVYKMTSLLAVGLTG